MVPGLDPAKSVVRYEALVSQVELLSGGELAAGDVRRVAPACLVLVGNNNRGRHSFRVNTTAARLLRLLQPVGTHHAGLWLLPLHTRRHHRPRLLLLLLLLWALGGSGPRVGGWRALHGRLLCWWLRWCNAMVWKLLLLLLLLLLRLLWLLLEAVGLRLRSRRRSGWRLCWVAAASPCTGTAHRHGGRGRCSHAGLRWPTLL